jgi:hypothetical protein
MSQRNASSASSTAVVSPKRSSNVPTPIGSSAASSYLRV